MNNQDILKILKNRQIVIEFADYLGMSRQGLNKALKTERNFTEKLINFFNERIVMIGKTVHFVDLGETPSVRTGVAVGTGISTTGYLVTDIKTKAGIVTKEEAFVYEDLKQAQDKLAECLPIKRAMEAKKTEAQTFLDAQRAIILGKPEFAHLLEDKKDEK